MTDRDKLVAMRACQSALDWIGDRTIEQAWSECRRIDWMLWLLCRIAPNDRRCRLAAADFAERVWHLIDNEPTRLAAAWAIDATRRGERDEILAAADAATYSGVIYSPSPAAAYAAYAASAASAAKYAIAATYATYADEAERAVQADILRGYFTASEVAKLFNAAIAKEGKR